MRLAPFVVTAALATMCPLDCARAQQQVRYYDARPPRPLSEVTGLEAGFDVGMGGHGDSSSAAFRNEPNAGNHLFWPGFGVQGAVGYRFIPWMSAGVHVGYQNTPPRQLPMGTTDGVANTLAIGFYARFYGGAALRLGPFDPWIGVGIDPIANVWVEHATPFGPARQRIEAVATPISSGLDVALTRHVAIGAMGQISPWIPHDYCIGLPGSSRLDCTSQNLATDTFFFAGAGMRFTIGG